MATVRMNKRSQIFLPLDARDALGVITGDEITVIPRGKIVLLAKKSRNILKELRGSAKGVYGDAGSYLKKERAWWEKSGRF